MKLDLLDDWCVEGWRRIWTKLSFWYTGITAVLVLVFQLGPILPPQIKDAIPQPWGSILTIVWFLGWVLTRVKAQGKPSA
jgi:hypothetical protein